MIPGNQRRDISQLLDDVDHQDLVAVAAAVWDEIKVHLEDSTCLCPAIEALAVLYERGYRLTREQK